MKFARTALAAAAVLASVGAHATLTPSNAQSTGQSFLALSSAGANGGTVGQYTITGGQVLSADATTADKDSFGNMLNGANFLTSGPSATTASINFASGTTPLGVSFISFLWGSPDTYNTLTVRTTTNLTGYSFVPGQSNGLSFSSTSGSQAPNSATYVSFTGTGGELITSLTFGSTTNAFEAANFAIAPVPEPETYALMLGGLGMLGFLARRRKSN